MMHILDVGSLNDDAKKHALQPITCANTQSVNGDDWDLLQKVLYEIAESVLAFRSKEIETGLTRTTQGHSH